MGNFQDLLAPTWRERARAADALLFGAGPTPAELQSLQPSPEVFLQALLSFWGHVAALQMAETMAAFGRTPQILGGWTSEHERAGTRFFGASGVVPACSRRLGKPRPA